MESSQTTFGSRSSVSESTGQSNAPAGIYIIVGLGLLSILLRFRAGFSFIDGGYVLIGTLTFLYSIGEVLVLRGLLRLQPWAWILTVLIHMFVAIVGSLTVHLLSPMLMSVVAMILGPFLSISIIVYLMSVADRFD